MQDVADGTRVAALGLDEDEAMAVAARTERSAFGALYLRHRTAVFAYLRARTSAEDAADLTALTFERAFAGIQRYRRREGGFRAWLFRIARNAAIDHYRRSGHSEHLAEAGIARSPEDEAVAHEALAELTARMATLGPDQREAISLRYAGGLTAREIGVVMGKSEAAAQKLVSRGLAALKEAYGVE